MHVFGFYPRTIPPDIRELRFLSGLDPLSMGYEIHKHNIQFGIHVMCRLIAEIQQVLVVRFEIVIFQLNPWVFDRSDLHCQAVFFSNTLDFLGQFRDGIDFFKLIEGSVFTRLGPIFDGNG